MRTKKKIIGITGCRSEYDILYPVMRLMEKAGFDVSVVVSGAHLSERFGYTVDEIEKDGFKIADKIYSLIDSDREIGKIKSSSVLMLGLSDSLNRLNPDFVMVVGDREEAIISGVVCTYLGIPLIHLCGGDRTSPEEGDVDEPIRHATTKLASLHFTMNEAHKKRILRMGEQPWRVFNSGDPGLDRFKEIEPMNKKHILNYFGFPSEDIKRPLIFVIQHVISGEVYDAANQIKCTLDAITPLNANCIINYPNSDMGSREIVNVINQYKSLSNVRITRNIPRKEFVNLLRNIDLLVGNSSMALLEGAFLKIPAINVGNRNKNRLNSGNVIFTDYDNGEIRKIAKKILSDENFNKKLRNCRSAYGDGKAAERIVGFFKKMNKSRKQLIAKDNSY